MKILSIGGFSAYGVSNTCLHRNWALHKLAEVDDIDTSYMSKTLVYRIVNRLFVRYNLPIHCPAGRLNRKIRKSFSHKKYDIVWIDKGVFISAKTLSYIKKSSPDTLIVGYSPDNMTERFSHSQHFLDSLPYHDYYVTTKSDSVESLKQLGAKNVIVVNNAFEPSFHHPYNLSQHEKERLGGKVGFIGRWEKERCDSMIYLVNNGVQVRIWGGGKWLKYKDKYPNLIVEQKGLFSEDYNKALSAFDISLCFLSKLNTDRQTTRTMEIPACGSMLMAERTKEHQELFEEDKEAVFFSSNEELLEKCRYYLAHPQERTKIAEAGHRRCIESDYSNLGMIKRVIAQIKNENTIHI